MRQNDCVTQAIAYALKALDSDVPASLATLSDRIPDVPLAVAMIPPVAAYYGLYLTQVPVTLPLSILNNHECYILCYRVPEGQHCVIMYRDSIYDPQRQHYVSLTRLTGNVTAIFHCQPACSVETLFGLTN